MTSEEVGKDYEHVEAMQKKFDDFQKDMAANEVRIKELTVLAERLKEEHYTEYEMIQEMIEVGMICHSILVVTKIFDNHLTQLLFLLCNYDNLLVQIILK